MVKRKIRILIADDHQILAEGLKEMLTNDEMEVVAIAADGNQVLSLLDLYPVDVVLLDIEMPDMDGIEALPIIKKKYPDVKVLILTTHDDGAMINSLMKNGASGYLLKNTSIQILDASIKRVLRDETVLNLHLTSQMINHMQKINLKPKKGLMKITRREKDVLRLLVKGHSVNQMAEALYISSHTVVTHKKNLFEKFNVNNSISLVRKVLDLGILDEA